MEARIDAAGRILLPKVLRDALGLVAGASVDVSIYGSGLQLVPTGRTARLREVDGVLAAESDTVITDEDVYSILDTGRR